MGHEPEHDPADGTPPWSAERRHVRARVSLLVQYRVGMLEDYSSEYSADLSPGGLFIQTEHPPAPGARVELLLTLKDRARPIECVGRVAHVHAPHKGAPGGFGVELTALDPESRERLERLCAGAPG